MLPVESGEKVSLEITVLLSLAVFMLVVSESVPPSSDNFPIIGTRFIGTFDPAGCLFPGSECHFYILYIFLVSPFSQ